MKLKRPMMRGLETANEEMLMKKIDSHENLTIVVSAQNLLALNGIECIVKKEFHGSGGHVGLGAVPIELWVLDEAKAESAGSILENELIPDSY